MQDILTKIVEKDLHVAIVGLGYVGLPLAVSFASAGVRVTGFDPNKGKVDKINAGENYIADISDDLWQEVLAKKSFSATTDFTELKQCQAILICVPTPLDQFHKPDMSFIESACVAIGKNMQKGTFVCLESTTYPTTTEDFVLPILECESGLKHGADFWLAFSPERVDPGNKTYFTRNTPKVLGALDENGLTIGQAIYKLAVDHIYPVSSPRVAEMVKILENPRKYLPVGQHKSDQRDGTVMRQNGYRHLGSDRRRRYQTLRIPAILSGAGHRRTLHPARPILSGVHCQEIQL